MLWAVNLEGGPRRVNHSAVAIGDKIYSFGGYSSHDAKPGFVPIDVHVLDTNNYRWTVVPLIQEIDFLVVPFQRYGHTAIAHGDNIYIWGGRNDIKACNRLYCFSTITSKWSKLETFGQKPNPRDGHTAVFNDNKIYIFGGYDDGTNRYSETCYSLDITTMTWSQVQYEGEAPTARDFHVAAVYKNKMFIHGGRGVKREAGGVGVGDVYYDNLLYLDLETHIWYSIEIPEFDKPYGRRSHSAFIYEKFLYIFGGFNERVNLHYNHLYRICLNCFNWELCTPRGTPPCERRRQQCVVVGDRMFLFGGTSPMWEPGYDCDSDKLLDHDDLHVLEFKPTLMSLCLKAVVQHNLNWHRLPRDIRSELQFRVTPNTINQIS